MKKLFILFIVILICLSLVFAYGDSKGVDEFDKTKELIKSKISCDKLTNDQLEEIGDYLMEQMHPGETHELMHNMMGGEDSETVKQMHVTMAKTMYCSENGTMMNRGMMGMNMMNKGMMQNRMIGSNAMGMMNYGNNTIMNVGLLVIIIVLAWIIWLLAQFVGHKKTKK